MQIKTTVLYKIYKQKQLECFDVIKWGKKSILSSKIVIKEVQRT